MKIPNFIYCVSCVGLMTIAICQSAIAVVAPANVDNQAASSSQIDQKLRRIDSELEEIALQMEGEEAGRKDKIRNIQKDLERIFQGQANREKKYCNGRIDWALNQECPE